MPKSITFDNDILKIIFNATAIANICDNAASSPLANLYLSLHTADPGTGGSQTTNETNYTNYVRISVSRASGAGGWTVTTNSVANASLAQFAQCGASGATLTHVAVGTAANGAGKVLYAGALSSPLTVSNGIQPQFGAGALTCTET
jgi:hypothetical protein